MTVLRRLLLLVLVAGGLGAAWASPAAAHAGGLVATDARSRVTAVTPAVAGLTVTAIEDGARLRLRNGTGGPVGVPAGGGPATPAVVAPGGELTWADERSTPVGRPPGAWSLVLDAGGVPVTVTGVVENAPPPWPVPWWIAVAAGALAVPWAARRLPRPDVAVAAAGSVALAASLAHVTGSVLAVESARPVVTFAGAAGVGFLAWPLIAGGVLGALRGRPAGLLAVCTGAALTAVSVLPDVTAFHRAVLPFAGPAWVDRALIVLTLAAGAGTAVAGAPALHRLATAPSAPAS